MSQNPPWFGLCYNTLTTARTFTWLRTLQVVMRCIVMFGLSSAITSSLHIGMHPPKREINPPKTACGCPCGRVTKKIKNKNITNSNKLKNKQTKGRHTSNPLSSRKSNTCVTVHSMAVRVTPKSVCLGNATTKRVRVDVPLLHTTGVVFLIRTLCPFITHSPLVLSLSLYYTLTTSVVFVPLLHTHL